MSRHKQAKSSVTHTADGGRRPGSFREDEAAERNEVLLRTTLELAVPLWVDRFIRDGLSYSDVLTQGRMAGEIVACQADALMFRTKYRENKHTTQPQYGTAGVFNALAKGIAAASFCPGGIRAFGAHFESDPKQLR